MSYANISKSGIVYSGTDIPGYRLIRNPPTVALELDSMLIWQLLSGVPATWIVHDSRTVELCDRLSLPNVSMTAATQEPYRHIIQESDYAPLFRNLNENFRYFENF